MTAAQSWLKKVTPEIFETLSLSEQGTLPPFLLDDFILLLKQTFQREDFSVSIEKKDFIDADKFYTDLSNKTISIPLQLHPLSGLCHFVMGSSDIATLIQSMQKESSEEIMLQNDEVIKGLYTYFVTEAIDAIHMLDIYQDLSLKICEGSLSDLSAFAIDLHIHICDKHLPARLLVTKELYKNINNHFKFIEPTLDNLSDMPDLSVPMTLNTGSVRLTQNELMALEEGDFIVIQNTFYKPNEKKGSFQMNIGKYPIFQVKMQKDGIKILDYLYFFNEETMDEEEINRPQSNDLPQEAPLNEEPIQPPQDDHLSNESYNDQPLENEHPHPEAMDEDTFDEDLNEVSDDDSMMSPEKTNLSDVELTINLEIARFAINLEELKQMAPGFKLPVNINPLQVNLVVSGKSIGTGEIIQVGDTTGVKVTKLNK